MLEGLLYSGKFKINSKNMCGLRFWFKTNKQKTPQNETTVIQKKKTAKRSLGGDND